MVSCNLMVEKMQLERS